MLGRAAAKSVVRSVDRMVLRALEGHFACKGVVAADSLPADRVVRIVAVAGRLVGIAGDGAVVAIAGETGIEQTWALVVQELLDTEGSS